MDSHEHLFFECSFAGKIWSLVRVYAEMESVRPLLHDITNWFQTRAHKRAIQVVVGKFNTYVKSKDIDLWHMINGDYIPTVTNLVTGKNETTPYDKLKEENKKMLSKNDEAKMVLYNALPKKEYERIFMCQTAKDVWNSLIITHQALDESFSSRNHVRKFLRALPTKWLPKVTAIEESKDLSTLLLDELIGNLKVYEIVLEKDSEASKSKKEKYKSLALKAKKVPSDEEVSCSDSGDEEYVMASFWRANEEKKGKDERMCFKCGDLNHFISDCPKHSYNDQKAFIGGCWSDSEEDDKPKKDEICLMAHDSNE
ncbi:zf-CCHC domain-containing protein, partial [Tanacetum coccineum]